MTWRQMTGSAVVGALLVLTLAACSSSGSSDGSSSDAGDEPTEEPGSTTTTEADDVLPERLQLRPVLAVVADPACSSVTTTAGAGPCDPGTEPGPESVPGLPELPEGGTYLRNPDGTVVYALGPVGFGSRSIATADVADQDGMWVIEVTVEDDEVDHANDAFNACYETEPTCPATTGMDRGSIAIVFADVVISAPAVNGPDLADDTFVISGDFTEAEAEEIAAAIGR